MDKVYEVTIPLEMYNELQEIRIEKIRVEECLEELFETAELSWDKDELQFSNRRLKEFLKSISSVAYKRRLEELKKEEMKDE